MKKIIASAVIAAMLLTSNTTLLAATVTEQPRTLAEYSQRFVEETKNYNLQKKDAVTLSVVFAAIATAAMVSYAAKKEWQQSRRAYNGNSAGAVAESKYINGLASPQEFKFNQNISGGNMSFITDGQEVSQNIKPITSGQAPSNIINIEEKTASTKAAEFKNIMSDEATNITKNELKSFTQFEMSAISKRIDHLAIGLGSSVNPEAYAMLKLDLFNLEKLKARTLSSEHKKVIQNFIDIYLTDIQYFLKLDSDNLASYVYTKQNYFNHDRFGQSKEFISKESHTILKNTLSKRFWIFLAVLGTASLVMSNETQAKVQAIALQPSLAFNMNPEDSEHRKIFNAIDSLKDQRLRESLVQAFEYAHEIHTLPFEQREAKVNQIEKDYIKESKELNFDQNRLKGIKDNANKKYTIMNSQAE